MKLKLDACDVRSIFVSAVPGGHRRRWMRGLVLLAGALLTPTRHAAAQSRWGVHVFGLSYHYQSRTYRDASGVVRHYEQVNPGLGLEYLVSDGERWLVSADAGLYRDSKDRGNLFAGPALRFRAAPHLMLGAGVVAMTSRTYATHVAPLPLLTGRWSYVNVNATWIPSVSRGESGAIGLFTTFFF